MKKFFYDIETTGTYPGKHGIHQISGKIVYNEIVETFDIKLQPNPNALIDPEALKTSNVTEEQIRSYMPFKEGYLLLRSMLEKYVDRFNKYDKFHLIGYNNRSFDDQFLRGLFLQNDDQYFGSYFWSDSIDVLVLASHKLANERHLLPNFKLATVARRFGIEVDDTKLHDALYDIELTEKIYNLL